MGRKEPPASCGIQFGDNKPTPRPGICGWWWRGRGAVLVEAADLSLGDARGSSKRALVSRAHITTAALASAPVQCAPAPADRCPSLRERASRPHAPRAALRRPAAGYRKLSEDEGGKLGEGTFGVVAKAIKLDTNAVVAIKKLRRVGASKTGMELPTLREIMLLQVQHHLRRTRG